MKFQSIYDNSPEIREKVTIYNNSPTMTKQEFKEESDINNIIARYRTTGLLTDPMRPGTAPPQFGDFSAVPDLMEAQNQLIEAEALFMELPSELRRRFDNDPLSLLEFLQSEDNLEEAIQLGLVNRPENISGTVDITGSAESAQNPT